MAIRKRPRSTTLVKGITLTRQNSEVLVLFP
uniref:Uncharacterized protein n=1 Tax=Arundo donax TaxID=35708 RepID=A0A0A9GGZ1_ARUDO